MKNKKFVFIVFLLFSQITVLCQVIPNVIKLVRQGVKRLIFSQDNSLPLASLNPDEIVGISSMFPIINYRKNPADVVIKSGHLIISSGMETETSIWFGGFNPYSTYLIESDKIEGEETLGIELSSDKSLPKYRILISVNKGKVVDVLHQLERPGGDMLEKSISVNKKKESISKSRLIIQMLGSGLAVFIKRDNLPILIAQTDFNHSMDLRKTEYLNSFHSSLYVHLKKGKVSLRKVSSVIGTGIGQSDIRAITYEDGTPLLNNNRLWYTMTIRGLGLHQQLQGVFSLNPTLFNIKLEGVILFDRNDGLLRNDIATHLFFDRREKRWKGVTTGFSAYSISGEQKQLLAIESEKDP